MGLYTSIIYLILFLLLFPVCLLTLLKSNLHQIFKKGEIATIRLFYVLISVGISYLVAGGITKLMEAIFTILSEF